MISKEQYEQLKERFGKVASWAVWKEPGNKPKSNVKDLNIFKRSDILSVLNPKYVFCGLNVGEDIPGTSELLWRNFHCEGAFHDYKLRYALMGTRFWGAYMTDAIKHAPEKDSNKFMTYLNSHPEVERSSMAVLREELDILGADTLIALGGRAYEVLSRNRKTLNGLRIFKIMSHAYYIGPENYRDKVLEALINA